MWVQHTADALARVSTVAREYGRVVHAPRLARDQSVDEHPDHGPVYKVIQPVDRKFCCCSRKTSANPPQEDIISLMVGMPGGSMQQLK